MMRCRTLGQPVASRSAPGVTATLANHARLAASRAASSRDNRLTDTPMRQPSSTNEASIHLLATQALHWDASSRPQRDGALPANGGDARKTFSYATRRTVPVSPD